LFLFLLMLLFIHIFNLRSVLCRRCWFEVYTPSAFLLDVYLHEPFCIWILIDGCLFAVSSQICVLSVNKLNCSFKFIFPKRPKN
jgi:hypothetical protein